jgi:CDP-diacylglycerol---serine O-phosphatidyltransferase
LIVYFVFLGNGPWNWTISFLYVAAAVTRLARFNVEQAGVAKSAFHGLPSPSAAVTLVTFYPFSQTAFFQQHLAHLPWSQLTIGLVVAISVLMVSHVLYPVVPKFSIRSTRGILFIAFTIVSTFLALTRPALFLFPLMVTYISYGLVKTAVLGFLDRLPDLDPLIDEDEESLESRELEYEEIEPRRPARRNRFVDYRRRIRKPDE